MDSSARIARWATPSQWITVPCDGARGVELCVTADDYGLAPAVNAGIERLARAGHITAASVMVHANAALDDVASLRATGIATGLHVVLVEERGLTTGDVLPPRDYRDLFVRLLRRPWTARALRREIEAQFERYDRLDLPFDFVNSHQHTHEFPWVWPLFAEVLARRPGVALRTAAGQPLRWSRQGALAASATISQWWHPARTARLSPIGVDFAGHATLDAIDRALTPPPHGALRELIVHTGDEDPALRTRYAHWGYHWGDESALLGSIAWQRFLVRRGVGLRAPRRIR